MTQIENQRTSITMQKESSENRTKYKIATPQNQIHDLSSQGLPQIVQTRHLENHGLVLQPARTDILISKEH